ncbi:tyrosine-type recombinase/integrase, partial [Pseudochrobactrum sp. sp1633]|uniref:tyrosine-type recombinase/integrase n=1 Tax=Pseudochrobactrum sp. sp1633 TaxID=3036706 RepID=UPI0025A4DD6A
IAQFDTHHQHRDYRNVHRDNVISYKNRLEERLSVPDKKQLSASTIVHSLIALKKFFQWLEQKTMVKLSSAGLGEYFSPSRELSALAAAPTADLFIPSMEQLRDLILFMPSVSLIHRRDRAILAVFALTGVRISALLSLRIQHVDIETRSIFQDARFVQTKNKKTMRTKWFPVGEDIENILIDWVIENLNNGANPTDPLFLRAMDPIRLLKEPAYSGPLRDQGTVRKTIECACKNIGIQKFKPHAVRSTLARFGNELCRSQKQLKAWSQNLGHENIKTTDSCYAKLDVSDQFAVLDELRTTSASVEMQNLMHILPSLPPEKLLLLASVAKGFSQNS